MSERSNEMLQKNCNLNPSCWTQHIMLFLFICQINFKFKQCLWNVISEIQILCKCITEASFTCSK